MSKNIYSADDFFTADEPRPKDLVQYVLDNVEDFGKRYSHAMRIIGCMRCSLVYADYELYRDISNAIYDYCADHDFNPNSFDIEQIF